MFGWGKRTKRAPAAAPPPERGEPGEPIIAALLLEGDAFDTAALERELRATKLAGLRPTDFQTDKGILMFQLGDELVAVAPMPAPYPWSDLHGPCETSWMWPQQTPATSVRRHRTHVLITAMGGGFEPIRRRLALTQVVGRAARQPGVLGVYWPEGTLVHYPPVFVEMAEQIQSAEAPPLYLWVDFRVFRNADGSSGLFTTGLQPLGQMEFEILRIGMPPGELREWAVNIAYYLLENGTKIKDGDTIGMSAAQQIRIRHQPSSFGAKGTVLQLQA